MIRGVVQSLDLAACCAVSFIYAPPQRAIRKTFWTQFRHLASKNCYPWLCIGDFNEIGLIGEKQGGTECRMSQLQFFLELLSDCALMDLEFKGFPFTWSNNQNGATNIRERLDQAMATVDWRALFPCAQVPRLFKFKTMWATSPMCGEVIKSKCDSHHLGSPMFQLIKKQNSCRDGLKTWSREHFSNNNIRIVTLKSELALLQAQPFSAENFLLQNQLKSDLECTLNREEMFIRQRSRGRWLNFGDKNSRFFMLP
ncbi:hypothetical protein ACSBR1_015170 [Camellia fascicularis]